MIFTKKTIAIKNTEFRTIKIFCSTTEEFKARCFLLDDLIKEGERLKEQ